MITLYGDGNISHSTMMNINIYILKPLYFTLGLVYFTLSKIHIN